jgi:integrase
MPPTPANVKFAHRTIAEIGEKIRTGTFSLAEYFLFWARMLKRLGIRYRRPYNMRHTYATAMLMAGMAPAFCAKQLGHSVEVFLGTYAKWIDGSHNDLEMARLESSLLSPRRAQGESETQ